MSTYQAYSGDYNQSNYGETNYGGGGFETNINNTNSSQTHKTQTKNSITPVTIKQINDSAQSVQEGEFNSHGMELSMVSCVGVVRNLSEVTTRLQVSIEDGTGSINITLWPKNGDEESHKFIKEGEYYHFSGAVNDFSGKRTLQHCVVRPINDYNEIIYHHLAAIDVYLASKGAGSNGVTSQLHQGNSLFIQEPQHNNSNNNSTGTLIDRVFNCIAANTPSMPEGVQVTYVASELGVTIDQVTEVCSKLTDDAKIYYGYDENGYLAV